jgi:NAD dependent epimerase/dehydratase family enzyme
VVLAVRRGDGRQYVSWIHYEDFVSAVRYLIGCDDIDGFVNVAAPNPLPNAEFMLVLREACGMPFGLPAAKWMLEIGAIFLRTETELILKSRRVIPARLLEHGFTFKFPDWSSAAHDLCRGRHHEQTKSTTVQHDDATSTTRRKRSNFDIEGFLFS